MKIAKCHVTGALIAQSIGLSKETKIVSIRKLDDCFCDAFEFTIVNDGLKEVDEPNDIPLIRPTTRYYSNGKIEVVDWGYEEDTI